jgi:hypothetical protein
MKLSLPRTAHGAVIAAVALSLVIPGSVMSQGGRQPVTPNSYPYLQSDTGNTASGATTFTSGSTGDAWHFFATGSSATALKGECSIGSACWGVQGTATGIGVYGSASNLANAGGSIYGVEGTGGSTGASGTSYGGYFTANNSASGGKAYGVLASGATAGVNATSSGNGVTATSTSTSGNGVYATGSGSSFYGVWGNATAGGSGIVGTSTKGLGVYGTSTGSTAAGAVVGAVYGYNSLAAVGSTSKSNSGVYGACTNCNGVFGTSANYTGVRGTATGNGTSTYGGYFTAKGGTAVYAKSTKGKVAFHAVAAKKASGYYAGVFDGNVRINGNYVATGTKSAVVSTSKGDRLMYAEEATQNYFSDQGSATLKRGRAVVKIDSLFAQTVDLSVPYMVIVTPQSFDTTGLGVGNLTAKSFEVRELNGGKGTFTFSWRITALRKGYTKARMAVAPANVGLSSAGALPTKRLSSDTPVTAKSVAPPTTKRAPRLVKPTVSGQQLKKLKKAQQ